MQNFIIRHFSVLTFLACLFVLTGLLAGCSTWRLGYANGESIAYWWLNSYVDFRGEQQTRVKTALHTLFVWHRATQLPDYAQELGRWQGRLQSDISQWDVMSEYGVLEKRTLMMMDRALPELADLALSLQPEQISHIERKFAANNKAYRKEYERGTLEQRQHTRYRKVMKQAEYWFGELSSEQETKIRAASDARPFDFSLLMAERLRWQQELGTLLRRIQREKPARAEVIAMLGNFVESYLDHFGNERQQAFFSQSREGTARLIVAILKMTTSEQKTRAREKLQEIMNECHVMAAKPM